MNRTAISDQLADWHVLPEPERLTELYFTDYAKLPKSLKAGATQTVAFTVHNLEHRPTTYHYQLVSVTPYTNTEQPLGDGTFILAPDDSRPVSTNIVVPGTEPRIGVKVHLYYQAVTPGNTDERIQTQSIDYWTDIANSSKVAS